MQHPMENQFRLPVAVPSKWFVQVQNGLELFCGTQCGGTAPNGQQQNPLCFGIVALNGIQVGCQFTHHTTIALGPDPQYVPISKEAQRELRRQEAAHNATKFGVPIHIMVDMLLKLKHPRSFAEFYQRCTDVTGTPLNATQLAVIADDKQQREAHRTARNLQAFQANGCRPRNRSRSRSRSGSRSRSRSRSPGY